MPYFMKYVDFYLPAALFIRLFAIIRQFFPFSCTCISIENAKVSKKKKKRKSNLYYISYSDKKGRNEKSVRAGIKRRAFFLISFFLSLITIFKIQMEVNDEKKRRYIKLCPRVDKMKEFTYFDLMHRKSGLFSFLIFFKIIESNSKL